MRNISKKVDKTFSLLCLLYIIAFLPASVAAEESNHIQIKDLEDKIYYALSYELEKNPDLKSCKITVDLDFEKDAESDKWNVTISKFLSKSEESICDEADTAESTVTEDDIDNGFNDDDKDGDNEFPDEDSDGGGNILGRIIGSAFVIIMLVAIFSRLKPKLEERFANPNKEKQLEHIRNHRQTMKNDSLENNEHQNNHDRDESRSSKGLEVGTIPSVSRPQTIDKPVSQEATIEKTQSAEITPEPVAPVPPVPIIKYGQIAVLSQDELTTEEDYMSDEPAGLPFVFSFSPNMEEGTYDISGPSRTSFLRDVNIIRPFVQNFDDVSNPTMIVTLNKGKLRRKGLSWVVTEKLKIQLK